MSVCSGVSFEEHSCFDTRSEVIDFRIQQGQKYSRLCDIGGVVGIRHADYESTNEESFSPAMRSTSKGTKSRTR